MADMESVQTAPEESNTPSGSASEDMTVISEPESQEEKLTNALNTLTHTPQKQTNLIFQALETQLLFMQPRVLSGEEKKPQSFKAWRSRLLPHLAFIKKTRVEGTAAKNILEPQLYFVLERTDGDARTAAEALYKNINEDFSTVEEFLDQLEEWWDIWHKSRA